MPGESQIPPVVIDFITKGLPEVQKAIQGLSAKLSDLEKKAAAGAGVGARARITAAQNETKTRAALAAKLAQSVTSEEKKAAAAAIGEAKKAAREVDRLETYKMRLRIRSSEMAGRYAARQAAEEIRAADRAAAAWGRVGRRAGGSLTNSVGRVAGTVGGLASGALGIGGGMILADALKRQMSAERSAAMLVNQVTTGKEPPAGANVANILGRASQVSRETGLSKEALIEGTRSYARTAKSGDFAGAMANMGFFAKMSQTTGTDINEIAGAAGMLQSQNAALGKDPAKMQQMLLDLYAQTKSGSLGMSQIITMAGRMGSVRGFMAGDEGNNQRKLMALGQLVAPETDPMESGTMVADTFLEAGKKQSKLAALGVKFDKTGRMESMEQMIGAVMQGTGGNLGKITELMGLRGSTLFRALQPTFLGAGGGAAGAAAVQAQVAGVTGSTMTGEDLGRQFEQMMSTPAEKFSLAWDRIIDTIENKAEPYLEEFADKLPQIMPYVEGFIDEMGHLVGFFAANPLEGLGALVLGLVTKDLAAAGIGAAVKIAIMALLGGSGPGIGGSVAGAAAGVLGSPVGKLAMGSIGGAAIATGGVVAAGAAGAGLGLLIGNAAAGAHDSLRRSAGRTDIGAANLALGLSAKARAGTVTAKDIQEAQGAIAQTQESMKGHWWSFGDSGTAEMKNLAATLQLLNKAVEDSRRAMINHKNATVDDSHPSPRGDPARQASIDARTPGGA